MSASRILVAPVCTVLQITDPSLPPASLLRSHGGRGPYCGLSIRNSDNGNSQGLP